MLKAIHSTNIEQNKTIDINKSQQILKKVEFKQLKGLKDVAIDLSEKPLIAIMGANGTGKSTILHALSCVYKPVLNRIDYRFPIFFTPTTHSIWNGSNFKIIQSYREESRIETDKVALLNSYRFTIFVEKKYGLSKMW
jgi:ABC-type branched-subunit amino acid transport system ATPase component